MKKQSILLILFILNMAMTFAQKAYRGTSSYASDIVCNVEKGKVYRGQSRYTSDMAQTSIAVIALTPATSS